jgi:tRNA (guanine37-N1)-methyltransferase
MDIHILTLFPETLAPILEASIIGRAQKKGLAKIIYHQLRNFAVDKRGTVDGKPYGGGVGMILRVEPVYNALIDIKKRCSKKPKTILLTTKGRVYTQALARTLSQEKSLILICPHYEGYDERIATLVDDQISIGNYILTGGEIPALVIVDSVIRLLPEVLTKSEAVVEESFSEGEKLEHPQYTRPEVFNGLRVPEILLSGHHGLIKQWKATSQKD